MSQHRALIELSVFQGDTLIARQSFDQDKIILGRISSADFRIPSPQVSRIHALLEILPDGQLKLTDLASTHGTFVNGSKIVEAILRETDQVKVADVTIKLVRVAKPAMTAASSASAGASSSAVSPSVAPPPPAPAVPPPSIAVSSEPATPVVPSAPREATVIRSLKSTASARGVLEGDPKAHEELEVTVYWEDTILAIDHYKRGRETITLGDGVKSTYIVTEAGIPPMFRFVEIKGSKVEVNLHPAMKMSARINGHMYTHEDLMKSGKEKIELGPNDIAKVRIGNIHFFLMFVPDPPPLARGPVLDKDPVFWSFFASTFVAAFLLMTYLMIFQKPIEGEVKEFPEKFRRILVMTYKQQQEKLEIQAPEKEAEKEEKKTGLEEKIKTPDAMQAQRNAKGGNEGEGKRTPGPEGKRGEQNAKNNTGVTVAPKVKGPDSKQPGPSKNNGKTAKAPSKFGLLQSLKNSGLTSKLAKMTGEDGGNDDLDKKFSGFGGGGMQSAKGVSPRGGLVGTGSGGGGNEAVIGVGGLGTKGFGQGAKGDGTGGIPGKGSALISTESGGISVGAGLSKEEIDRVVKSHMNELEFCFQQAKQRNPDLAGKLALGWTILNGGVVAKARAKANSTGDAGLMECFMRRLQQWRFPSPPSGASAEVEYYPFPLK
ncbi:MAG: AgmX/PglI C-terminal domain-containing protein [Bdellovibrionota bacterium]